MRSRAISAFGLVLAVAVASDGRLRVSAAGQHPVTVHEWGTFTTVASQDGPAEEWLPLSGPTDLPCFVETFRNGLFKYLPGLPAGGYGPLLDYQTAKRRLRGTVRMETPVLYFYADGPADVDVSVSFSRGLFTEWYPKAIVAQVPTWANVLRSSAAPAAQIAWRNVGVRPRSPEKFPSADSPSHYYAARETDAAPIRVAEHNEKFLFYRGVGGFATPVAAAMNVDSAVTVRMLESDRVPALVVFLNRGGRVGYSVHRAPSREITVDQPAVGSSATSKNTLAALRGDLSSLLVAEGLYKKEADAMVETWRDTWFEEGTRVLYIVPQAAVDRILPLTVTPRPAAVARVFVGRMDVITEADLRDVRVASARDDRATLARYGRLLGVIGDRILKTAVSADERRRIETVLDRAFNEFSEETDGCE